METEQALDRKRPTRGAITGAATADTWMERALRAEQTLRTIHELADTDDAKTRPELRALVNLEAEEGKSMTDRNETLTVELDRGELEKLLDDDPSGYDRIIRLGWLLERALTRRLKERERVS